MDLAATVSGRDALAPRRPPGMRLGLALAVAAHVLLILAIAFGVAWKTSEPDALVAELWAPTVQQAAPRAVAADPPPPQPAPRPTPQPPQPAPAVQPPQEPAPVPRTQPPPRPVAAPTGPSEAEIALERQRARQQREAVEREKARREDQRREQQEREQERQKERQKENERERIAQQKEREEQQRRDKAEAEKRRLAEAEREKREAAERELREERQLAAIRDAQMRRIQGQAGATGEATATGTAARSAGPSAGYAGRIRARVKPNITLTGDVPGNPTAVVEVRAAPDGTIVGRRIVQSSGSAAWDDTVLRAIDKTEILPRDTDGSVPSPITIAFKPRE
jgi:colicin import membrane protein